MEIEKLSKEKENVNEQVESLRFVVDQKREHIFKTASQSLALKEKVSEMKMSQVVDARTSYALSLYGKISGIQWNYNGPTGHISGCECSTIFFLLYHVTNNKTCLLLRHYK